MKKFFSMLVMVLLMISLAGCSKSMNYVIGNEPSFVGTVEVVTDEYVLVNVNDDDAIYSDHPNIQVTSSCIVYHLLSPPPYRSWFTRDA